MADINKLIEELGNLTMQEAADLGKTMEEKWGINYNSILNSSAPASAAPVEGAKKTVTLKGYTEGKKILVLKAIKALLGLGLMESKNFVEALPKVVEADCEDERASEIVKELTAAGGETEVK